MFVRKWTGGSVHSTMQSRRGFTNLLLGLVPFCRALSGGASGAPETGPRLGPGEGAEEPAPGIQIRRYRADAVVLLLGIPICRLAAVGGGQASFQETSNGGPVRRTLFFAAGSDPKRARGLNRLGWIREEVVGSGSNPIQAKYFGVLTSSPEEDLNHARKSIASAAPDRCLYSTVTGSNTVGRSRSAVKRFEFAADANWSDHRLITQAQSSFHANVTWRESSWPDYPVNAPPTFLFELARLLKQRASKASGRYVYNEQEYRLEVAFAQPDLRAAGTVKTLPVRGRVRNMKTGRRTEFRLWLEDSPDSLVPVRIDFQPRSCLRLSLEAEPRRS